MTLKELYDELDWSEVNEAEKKWLKKCPIVPPDSQNDYEGSLYRLRCALLEGAVNDNDRWAQVILGDVWNQVCQLLKVEGKCAVSYTHLTLPTKRIV